jgi:hypothetical protein
MGAYLLSSYQTTNTGGAYMNIDHMVTLQVWSDTRRSRITPLFKPLDDEAVEFLETIRLEDHVDTEAEAHFVKPVTMAIAVCTATKGETLASVSQKLLTGGWHYGTLADWYRYLKGDGLKDTGYISLPSELYRDEEFHEWYPRVSYCPKTVGRILLGKVLSATTHQRKEYREAIAEVLMRPLQKLVPFQGETKILVVKIIEEEKKGKKI